MVRFNFLKTLGSLLLAALPAYADLSVPSPRPADHAGVAVDTKALKHAEALGTQHHYVNYDLPKVPPADKLPIGKIQHGYGDGGTSSMGDAALAKDKALVSENGRYKFVMQGDCNAVVYENGKDIWSSKTFRKKPFDDCRFRLDYYDSDLTSAALVIGVHSRKYHDSFWGRNGGYLSKKKIKLPSDCIPSALQLTMQNDGNLVLYCGKTALWDSKGNVKK